MRKIIMPDGRIVYEGSPIEIMMLEQGSEVKIEAGEKVELPESLEDWRAPVPTEKKAGRPRGSANKKRKSLKLKEYDENMKKVVKRVNAGEAFNVVFSEIMGRGTGGSDYEQARKAGLKLRKYSYGKTRKKKTKYKQFSPAEVEMIKVMYAHKKTIPAIARRLNMTKKRIKMKIWHMKNVGKL